MKAKPEQSVVYAELEPADNNDSNVAPDSEPQDDNAPVVYSDLHRADHGRRVKATQLNPTFDEEYANVSQA